MRMILTGSLSQSCHPHTDTFNTARHSSRATQYQEDYQPPLTCSISHIFAHTQTHTAEDGIFHTHIGDQRQEKLCIVHQWRFHDGGKADRDKTPRSLQTFNRMTRHQRGSEARHSDRGGIFGLSHSSGHIVLLTFCLGNTKGDRAPKSTLSWLCVQQVGGWSKWSWQMAAFVCIMCVPECLWVESSESAFFLSAVER